MVLGLKTPGNSDTPPQLTGPGRMHVTGLTRDEKKWPHFRCRYSGVGDALSASVKLPNPDATKFDVRSMRCVCWWEPVASGEDHLMSLTNAGSARLREIRAEARKPGFDRSSPVRKSPARGRLRAGNDSAPGQPDFVSFGLCFSTCSSKERRMDEARGDPNLPGLRPKPSYNGATLVLMF
jgi:hypothetical protein